MKKSILFIFCLILFSNSIKSQTDLFEKREFTYKGKTLPYRILFPENYNKSIDYPLVVFLHGAGERGTDNEKQLVHGSKLFTDDFNRKKFPAIVVFPQCPQQGYWAPIKARENGFSYVKDAKPTEPMQLVIRLIQELKKKESVDKNRMYVLGLSMGGMGTFDLICRYPREFAAAVPICGGVNTDRLKKIRKMPLRIYHGADDNLVSPEHSKSAYNELQLQGAKQVELIIFPGVGHGSWDPAFAQPDFLSWLFEKRK